MARALTRLQAAFGAIPRLKGRGAGAAAVRGMLARMRREQGAAAPAVGRPMRLTPRGKIPCSHSITDPRVS